VVSFKNQKPYNGKKFQTIIMTDDKSATIHEEFNNVSSNMLWRFMDGIGEKCINKRKKGTGKQNSSSEGSPILLNISQGSNNIWTLVHLFGI
jgi:hypothetical protein